MKAIANGSTIPMVSALNSVSLGIAVLLGFSILVFQSILINFIKIQTTL